MISFSWLWIQVTFFVSKRLFCITSGLTKATYLSRISATARRSYKSSPPCSPAGYETLDTLVKLAISDHPSLTKECNAVETRWGLHPKWLPVEYSEKYCCHVLEEPPNYTFSVVIVTGRGLRIPRCVFASTFTVCRLGLFHFLPRRCVCVTLTQLEALHHLHLIPGAETKPNTPLSNFPVWSIIWICFFLFG